MRVTMWRATEQQRHSIREFFDKADLTVEQQNALMFTLVGHMDLDILTQGQATIVLSSMIARGPGGLRGWANELIREKELDGTKEDAPD